jgi:serine/threonine-protein kinase
VFRAYDAERERLVAVKLFRLDLPPERVHQLVASFEELISAELTHPAIVEPLASGISGVSAYLAHDYVAAESLDLAVREYGPAPPADALRVAAQLAGALDFAAIVNVSHGALHPRDVLLSTDQARLVGFGVARALDRVGVSTPIRRPYSAPERAAGHAWDRRADVFSLAALVYELLSGRRITGHGSQAADDLAEVPGARLRALRATFARALAEDPNDRFGTALEFAEALKDAFPDGALTEVAPARRPSGSARKASEPRLPLEEPRLEEPLQPAEPREPAGPLEPTGPHRAAVPRGPAVPLDSLLHLRTADLPRHEDVRAAPRAAAPEVPTSVQPPRARPVEPPSISVIEQSRSAVWPLMAALVVGLAIGFAGGYGIGERDRQASTTLESPPSSPSELSPTPSPGASPSIGTTSSATPVAPASTSPAGSQPNVRSTNGTAPAQQARRAAERSQSSRPSRVRPPADAIERSNAPVPSGTAGGFAGLLTVASRPEGARVFLDGKLMGTTPLAIPNVGAGEHAIRLELDGYQRWSSSVRIVASEQNRVTASLEER